MAEPIPPVPAYSICNNCGDIIETTIFKGTGYCSNRCRKALGLDTVGNHELRGKLKQVVAKLRSEFESNDGVIYKAGMNHVLKEIEELLR